MMFNDDQVEQAADDTLALMSEHEVARLELETMIFFVQLKTWGVGHELPETFPQLSAAQKARLLNCVLVLRALRV